MLESLALGGIEKWAVNAGGYSIKRVLILFCFVKIEDIAGLYGLIQ